MEEEEKMLAGLLYEGNQEELVVKLYQAQDLCYEYNNILPSKVKERKEMMKKILGKIKREFLIEQPFMCDRGYN